ncbi:hypothetical protein RA2_03898 [Roseovarius sp. A-2]|uniref:hypothetical protein n=1 Tax=Roseovarius sp. A-2 TaxID=1570360 RepID=UPI0009B53C78|nr:hypothetical protein [Roseovarius sp. A-2]GAW36823.1 hypothetical protein RA2_03898 [Roseovarius sp. A-2]
MMRFLALLGLLVATACTNANDLDEAPAYLGNFRLGHNVVVAPNLTKGPASREATAEEWITGVTKAIEDRFSRYEGSKYYHLGISIEGYVLAIPGIPLVAAPKSALILHVTVWDDAAGKKLNEQPHMVTVVETISPQTFLSSGLTQSKEVQLENLSRNAAKQIQNWMARQNDEFGWFEADGRPAHEKTEAEKALNAAPPQEESEIPAPEDKEASSPTEPSAEE